MSAAGDRYDATVREVWSGIDQELSTREAWALARPGMVAAQRRFDDDLADERWQMAVYGSVRTPGDPNAETVITHEDPWAEIEPESASAAHDQPDPEAGS